MNRAKNLFSNVKSKFSRPTATPNVTTPTVRGPSLLQRFKTKASGLKQKVNPGGIVTSIKSNMEYIGMITIMVLIVMFLFYSIYYIFSWMFYSKPEKKKKDEEDEEDEDD